MTRNIDVWKRRLEYVIANAPSIVAKPVACLKLISVFTKKLSNDGISESIALLICPIFLSGEALELLKDVAEEIEADLGGFTTWPKAVPFFFRTYAEYQCLEDYMKQIYRLSKSATERVMDFYCSLTKHARDLGGVFYQNELMTSFQSSLHADIRLLLRSVRKSFTGPNSLADFAEHAATIIESHSTIQVKTRPPRTHTLLIEEKARKIPTSAQRSFLTMVKYVIIL